MSMTMTKAQAIALMDEHWVAITYGTNNGRVRLGAYSPNSPFFSELWAVEEKLSKLSDDSVIEIGD